MLFNSKVFVAFLAVVLAVYYPLSDRAKIRFLLACSWLFYGFWDPRLLALLVASTLVDYVAARAMSRPGMADGARRRWLYVSLAANLGMLGFFKYYDFFVTELAAALGAVGLPIDPHRYLLHVVLPVGISFYTFQTMGYTIDVYRRDLEHDRDFTRFALFVSFFPQLVAGPVERARHLLGQFARPFRLSPAMVREGVFLILLGYVKKVVIADRIARLIDPLFAAPPADGPAAATAMALFTCQIYVDFSSYSDIAIGLGLLLGYRIRRNFDLPLIVPSLRERWRRWHISMSEWFRDYIFLPLGGSRRGAARGQANVLIVMFLSGLWHGASTTFVTWGVGNGVGLVGQRALSRPLAAIGRFLDADAGTRAAWFYARCLFTYCLISALYIFFRCPDWPTATAFVRAIFLTPASWQAPAALPAALREGLLWLALVVAAHEAQRHLDLRARVLGSHAAWTAACALAFAAVVTFGIAGPQFIYFQF